MHRKLRELVSKYQENCARIDEIADLCEKEKRERSEAETSEYNALVRENQMIQMRMSAMQAPAQTVDTQSSVIKATREAIQNGGTFKIPVQLREGVLSTNADAGGLVPVKIQDILDPLTEGLIVSKLGLPMPTGLSGTYQWPLWDIGDATVAGEGVAVSETALTLDKMTAAPERIAVMVKASREALIQSDDAVRRIIYKAIPLAVSRLINQILLSTTKVTGATNLAGPFVALASSATSFSATPTFLEFVEMKASVLATGIEGDHLCWIMTQAQKAIAEATPKDAGSGIMICENDRIAGIPVFCSHYIGENNIGLGDFLYQPLGLFGNMDFIVDPYTDAASGLLRFILNADFATKTIRSEAFALATVATA